MVNFIDKVQQVAKSAVSSAEDLIETQKLNMKISDEQKKIKDAKTAIGELVWQAHDSGQADEEKIEEQLAQIRVSTEMIAELERQIAGLKAAAAAAKEQPAQPQPAPMSPSVNEETSFCPACGVRLPDGANFCPGCGQPR